MAVDRLAEIAAESANLDRDSVVDLLANPDWKADRRWQWEFYIPGAMRDAWQALNLDARLVAFVMASRRIDDGIAPKRL